jgi:hypothetical protein
MDNNKKKKKDTRDLIIEIILIIIIIILLFHNYYVLKKGNTEKIPTGNIDVIEIKCDKEDTCIICDNTPSNYYVEEPNDNSNKQLNNKTNTNTKDKQTNTSTNTNTNTSTDNTDNTDDNDIQEPDDDEFTVKDKKIKWNGVTEAKIFTNSMYELSDIIAPETSNTYQFVVRNGTNYNLKYKISFNEKNEQNINMKYKLKKNDTYIVDHYVSYDELNVEDLVLNSKTHDTYYLEWKWISSDNDTEIGKNPNSKYELKIEVKAESAEE